MIWKTSEVARTARFSKWHVWRAWHPVKIDDTWYWFENVLRKGSEYETYGIFSRLLCMVTWQYKPHYLKVIDE